MLKDFLEQLGFTNIIENENGTYDATKDNFRYTGLYLSNVAEVETDPTIVQITPCTWI
jgi:hypothetical protein